MKFQLLTVAAAAAALTATSALAAPGSATATASHLRTLQTAPDATAGRQEEVCAAAGERSKACPGVDPAGDRPSACCGGLTCVGARCRDTTSAGACAAAGQKALECGINQTGRPAECCTTGGGVRLVCNAAKFCVDPAELAVTVEEEEEEEGVAVSGGGMGDELASALGLGGGDGDDEPEEEEPEVKEEPPMVEEEPPMDEDPSGEKTAPETTVEEPAKPPVTTTVVNNGGSCGLDGAKSEACGAAAKDGRPAGCCPSAPFCHPTASTCTATHPKLAVFGAEGDKVENCGADAKDGRPLLCAEGLYCDRATGTCTAAATATGDTATCGEAGDKSMDCGVGSEDTKVRPQSCCPGMYCGEDKRCAPLSDNAELMPDLPEPEGVTVVTSDGDEEDEEDMGTAVVEEPVEWTHPSIETCGEDGDKVVNCGAGFKEGRPFLCCEGLYCDAESGDPVCTPTAVGNTDFCAETGDKAMDCGVKVDPEKDRAQSCCEGLYCGPDRRCIPLAEFPEFVDLAAGAGVTSSDANDKDGKMGEGTSSASALAGTGFAAVVGFVALAFM